MVIHDYTVSYEIECDPVSESCFIGCEDEECSKEYFYAKIERYAPDLVKLCGDTIVGCEFANVCTIDESRCFLTFCDTSTGYDSCDNYEQEETSL